MNNLFVNQDTSSEILVSEEQSTQDLLYNGDKSEDILAPVQYEEYGLFAEQDNLKYIPLATKTTYGIIKVGDGLEVVNGVLNVVGGGSSDITKLSQLENDVGFITNDVDDLHHYYNIDAINVKFEDVMTLSDTQIVSGIKIFTETIGLLNTDGTLDRIRHINNNFLIVDQNGTALLDIDEGFKTIKSFGKELAFVEDIPDLSDVPTKVSDLINDTGFITSTVDNLVNYYLKTEQYSKKEINELVSKIPKFDIEVVDDPNTIPEEERSETTIYLVPRTDGELNDYYEEIIWIHNTWERLGSTKINLSNYYTKTDADKLFLSKTDANSTFAKIRDIPDVSNFATKDEIPTDYAKLSDIKTKTSELINDSGFIDKDVNNLTQYYTIAETSQLILDNIPTQLAQLDTDTNNQRVSVSEKTKWNNKSDFSGDYNSLTNKPNLSNYLTASGTASITGAKTYNGKTLLLAPSEGSQPTYVYIENDAFKVDGQYSYIELDDSGATPIIRLLGYDMVRKEDIPNIPDTSNLATTNTEQTFTAVKTIEGLKDKEGNDLIITNGNYNYFNSLSKHLFLKSTQRPWLYIGNSNSYVRKEMAFTDDILTIDDIYPINSIYLTVGTEETGTASPASFLGGTWERLPEGYALWTASSSAGTTISAGLPNISGSFQLANHSAENTTASGAFVSTSGDSASYTGSSSNKRARTDVEFYASNSNSIYGNSTTVQPPAYKVYAWKRIS